MILRNKLFYAACLLLNFNFSMYRSLSYANIRKDFEKEIIARHASLWYSFAKTIIAGQHSWTFRGTRWHKVNIFSVLELLQANNTHLIVLELKPCKCAPNTRRRRNIHTKKVNSLKALPIERSLLFSLSSFYKQQIVVCKLDLNKTYCHLDD